MFDAIINGRIDTSPFSFEVEYHDIEELNKALLDPDNNDVDISKMSFAALPAVEDRYTLLECGAALGRGNGPLLVRRRGESSPLNRVAVPGVHTTAASLLSRLFPTIGEQVPMLFSDIATAVEQGEVDAGVLIHEGRFVYHERNLELVADLGLLWEEKMALPLPLGAIVMRSGIDPTTRQEFEKLLRKSIEYAFANPMASRKFIKQHAQELSNEVIDSHIALFVNAHSLDLGTEGHHAIEALLY